MFMYLESRINSYTRTSAYVDNILISFGINSENAFSYSKGKAIPLQAWICREGSRRLKLSDFKTFGT